MSLGRRAFIIAGGGVAVGAGTYAWLRKLGYDVDPPPTPFDRTPREKAQVLPHAPFDALALAVLAPLLDHLIPGDDAGLPSATQAGVLDFLGAAAAAPGLLAVRNEILKLTRLLDITAKKAHLQPFAELEQAQRQAILEQAAAGELDRRTFKPARAMQATLRLGLEGYLGHPHHGGNRNASVWDALSIPMPRERTTHGHGGDGG